MGKKKKNAYDDVYYKVDTGQWTKYLLNVKSFHHIPIIKMSSLV